MIGGAVVQKDPPTFSRISDVVQSRFSTGYFDTAALLLRKEMPVRQLLRNYPMLMDHFYLHPRQKPPGLILFEMAIIRVFGEGDAGALASGWLIAALASLSVISTYLFIACFTESRDAAFFGASYFALCPSLLMFYPDFDICFPNLTALLTVLWAMSLKKDQIAIFGDVRHFRTPSPGCLPISPVCCRSFSPASRSCNIDRTRNAAGRGSPDTWPFRRAFSPPFISHSGRSPDSTPSPPSVSPFRQVNLLWDKLINVYHYPHHSLPWTILHRSV